MCERESREESDELRRRSVDGQVRRKCGVATVLGEVELVVGEVASVVCQEKMCSHFRYF